MGGTISSVACVFGEATAGEIVSGAVSSFSSTYQMQQDLDVTLDILEDQLMKLNSAFVEARERRITNPKLLEWWAKLIADSYRGNYYHRTFKHRNSLPLMIESEDTPTNRAAKRRRIIRTLLFGDEEMKNLYDVLKRFQSIDVHAFLKMVYAQPKRPIKTYLYMDHYRLFGRDKERQQVMDFLFKPTKAGENNVSMLPIVGLWGVGKTSLALHCFYDPKVENHFSLKIYIRGRNIDCYDLDLISKEILKQCNSIWTTNYNDLNTLLVMLKNNLSSERILLVLDSVDGVDSMGWNALWDCLNCGKQGSKVIFISSTFHYERYHEIVCPKAEMKVMIDSFPEDEHLLFFFEHSLGGANTDDYPELAGMGREMVKMMNGSIWMAKILGELLRDNLNAPFWSNSLQAIRDSWAINDVTRALPYAIDDRLLITVMCQLLPGRLVWRSINNSGNPINCEVKTFRELMALGPNHCRPLIKEGVSYGVKFWLRGHGFLDKHLFVRVVCVPLEQVARGLVILTT